MIRARVGALLGATLLLACASVARATDDPSCGRMAVAVHAGTLVYRLPHAFLSPGSDSVHTATSVWVRGRDYALDMLHGELRLLREPVPGDTVWVDACWLLAPPPLEAERRHYRPAAPVAAAVPDTAPAVPERAGIAPDRLVATNDGMSLNVAGSKMLAVDFGSNQDAALRQSLDLTLSGRLSPTTELTGVLSDHNAPLLAGGSTQDLQAFDRVMLELRSPTLDAQLGDVDVSLAQGEFARVQRRLQGLSAGWRSGGSQLQVAAANTPGEYRRTEFYGIEGVQGPYTLAPGGTTTFAIVPGSEVVVLDGERLSRGESADYFMDYDAGRITFTSRRPISSGSRITVEFQFSQSEFHRRMMLAGGRWEAAHGWVQSSVLSESDDRGRPVDGAFGPADLAAIALAGDSAARAVAVEIGSGGDYDTMRVDSTRLAYRYVGSAGGRFSVPFTSVGVGRGDYEAYAVPSGTAYRYVGQGLGSYRVGRTLPLPESHQLVSAGGGVRLGPLAAEVEGAASRFDRNTLSSLEDGDNTGGAGRASLSLETHHGGLLLDRSGVTATVRGVDPRFTPFGTLSAPFEAERWGFAPSVDLDHRREAGVEGFASGRAWGELRGSVGKLTTPEGFASDRRDAAYTRSGFLTARLGYAWAHGRDTTSAFADGHRERIDASLRLNGGWLQPAVQAVSDSRTWPSDSLPQGARTRSAAAQLSTGSRIPWLVAGGYEVRLDALPGATGFVDQAETRIVSSQLRSPDGRRLGGELSYQHRDREPRTTEPKTASDLGALRLRADGTRGLSGRFDLELSGDGESRRERHVLYAGPSQGAYDSLGNFVGTGDYAVAIVTSPTFDRVSRAVTSARVAWELAPTPALQGTRIGFDYETETRRRGDLHATDPWPSPAVVLGDPDLALARLTQRVEGELAPTSRFTAVRLRVERQINTDRSYDNFGQSVDSKSADLTWRLRPTNPLTAELEGLWRKQAAVQQLAGAGGLQRGLEDFGGTGRVTVTPDTRLRAAGVVEATWSRPHRAADLTRAIRIGPELGLAIGRRGHLEMSARRGFVSGATPSTLLPTSEPAGPARWDATSRLDYRVHETTTVGLQLGVTDRATQKTRVTGRCEVRALF